MKSAIRWTVVALVVAALGFFVQRYVRSREPKGPTYQTVEVDRGRISARVTATGTLSALVTVLVGTQVSGRIDSIRADFNSVVKKGDVIATLEPSLFRAAVEQASANYESAKAAVDKAKAQEADAELKAARQKQLGAQGLVTQSEVETAEANLKVGRASTTAAQAGVKQAAAALHQAQVNLKYATILSPIDGVVISRNVDVGQTVAASLQTPTLFTIAQDLTKMQVHTSVAEGDVGKIVAGQNVVFTVDAYPGKKFQGAVRQVRDSAVTVQNVVTYDAVVDVDNGNRLLKPGMTATVTFTPAERNDVLRIPNAALRFQPDSKSAGGPSGPGAPGARKAARSAQGDRRTVYRLKGTLLEPVEVQIGITDGSVTELVGGELHEKDSLVTETITDAPASGAPQMPFGGGAPRGMR